MTEDIVTQFFTWHTGYKVSPSTLNLLKYELAGPKIRQTYITCLIA